MARVNDGTLLQHFVDCEVAQRLAAAGDGRLRLVATHAMAPYEPARNPEPHAHNARVRRLLAGAADEHGRPPLVRAWARCGASLQRYPNSAELLAVLFGRTALAGVLCEQAPEARAALEAAWSGGALRVWGGSWREALREGVLFPPPEADRPWLVTMDPYTWRLDGEVRREQRGPHLLREDFEALRPCLAAHVRSGHPGAFCAFVYGLDEVHAAAFRRSALQLADRLGLERVLLGLEGPGATRHLGVVMSSLEDLAAGVARAWHDLAAEG